MAFIQAKAIKVYYTKGDRKPYDVNGKPLSYLGQDSIGANIATQVRFYLGENLGNVEVIAVSKRADGQRVFNRLNMGTDTEVTPNQTYYYFELGEFHTEVVGKLTIALKVYSGTVEFDDEEAPTTIVSTTGRIVVSDIFHIDIAYAPEADDIMPPYDPDYWQQFLNAFSTKADKQEVIQLVNTLPTVSSADDGKWFLLRQTNGGRLYRVLGGVAVEVETEMGQLKLTPTGNGEVTTNTGQVAWEQENGTAKLGLYNDVVLHLGEDVMYYAKASGAIVKGDVVQFAGYEGDHAIIKKAVPSEINVQPKLIMGIAKQDIANNEFGYVLAFGKLESVDTKGYTNGTLIWFDSASGTGQWTNVVPTAPNAKVLLAVVVKQESSGPANNGVILVRPTFESKLDDLQNVLITSAVSGDVLRYDGTKWVNTNALTTAETEIDTLQGDVIGLDNTKADITYVDSQDDDLSNRITFIETNGGIDFIKVANFASLPSSGDVRNHRLFMTIDTKQLWEFDGTQYNESSPTDLSTIEVSAEAPNDVAMNVIGDSTLTADILRVRDGNGDIVAVVEGDGDVVLENDLVVEGNLTVNGTTTTVNTETVAIEDNIILINSNQTGTPSGTLKGGIEVERGSETNYQFVFDESDDRFKIGQVGSLQTVATRQDDVNMVASGVPFYNDTEKRFDTSSNLKVNASGQLVDTTIQNSVSGNVPLQINGVSGSSILQYWFINNNPQAFITGGRFRTVEGVANFTSSNNSYVNVANTGTNISRNVNDANPSLIVNEQQGTGNIANFQFGGANKLEITKDGYLTKNGNLYLHSTGLSATALGDRALRFGGSYSVAFGDLALFNSGQTANTAIGNTAGFTLTSGTFNTFLGYSSGNNASQLVSATNSTALGNGSFTDKSNQMVFGNASVSEFKFDRNTSAIVLMPQIQTSSSSPSIFERTGTDNSSLFSSFSIRRKTTADMADGFGNGLSFEIIDNAGVVNQIGVMGALRSGADNSGRFTFLTNNAGTLTEKMTILPNGNVGIGTNAPAGLLHVRGSDLSIFERTTTDTNTTGSPIVLRRTTTGDMADGFGGGVVFQIRDSANVDNNIAVINAIRSGADNSGRLAFFTSTAGSITERMNIMPNGNVGIGTNVPSTVLELQRSGDIDFGFKNTADTSGNFWKLWQDNYDSVPNANFLFKLSYGSTDIITANPNGRVGIGTTAPTGFLHLVRAGYTNILGETTLNNEFSSFQLKTPTKNFDVALGGSTVSNTALRNAFFIFDITANVNRFHIDTNGLVGINETSPSAQLQVKSGATNRVPLIVDTLASHTASLAEFKLNNATRAYFESDGGLRTPIIRNLTTSANSTIDIGNNGTIITRNVADGNHSLVVNLDNSTSTGSILVLRRAGVTQANIARDGIANFTGTPSNEQTGDYTLVLADKGKVLRVNSSSNRTITIPLNSSVAFPIDTEIALIRYGSGTVSISPTSGVTLNSIANERKVKDQYGSCALKKIGTDEWVLVGSLEA